MARADVQLGFRRTKWDRFKGTSPRNAPIIGDRRVTHFERFKPGTFASLSTAHEKYVPTEAVQITLHCRKCRAAKLTTIQVTPGMARPRDLMEYQCANCSPRHAKRNYVLSKRFPLVYGSWRAMTARCYCKAHSSYADYGGRGITICPRWTDKKNGFANFLTDMGDRTPELSIDRINVNGNYSPSNCKWSTATEQAGNKRCSVLTDKDLEEHEAFEKQEDEFLATM